MKTLLLIILSIPCFSQTTIHFYASSEKTTGAELLIPVRNTSISLGGGFSGAWDVHKGSPKREEWCSLYAIGSAGYLCDVMVKYRTGLSTYTQSNVVIYKPMIGISGMYSISKDVGLEVGFDTFNKLTLGLTVIF